MNTCLKITNINWNVSEEDIAKEDLPSEVSVLFSEGDIIRAEEDDSIIIEKLGYFYGWQINSLSWEKVWGEDAIPEVDLSSY